jgi:hypothetical protein
MKAMDLIKMLGEKSLFTPLLFLSKELVIPALCTIVILQIISQFFAIWKYKLPLRKIKKGTDDAGNPYEDITEYRP